MILVVINVDSFNSEKFRAIYKGTGNIEEIYAINSLDFLKLQKLMTSKQQGLNDHTEQRNLKAKPYSKKRSIISTSHKVKQGLFDRSSLYLYSASILLTLLTSSCKTCIWLEKALDLQTIYRAKHTRDGTIYTEHAKIFNLSGPKYQFPQAERDSPPRSWNINPADKTGQQRSTITIAERRA